MEPAAAPAAFDVESLRRSEFPHLDETVYLNAAAVAPLPQRAVREIASFNQRRARIQDLREADFSEAPRLVRERAAALVGAGADEIAIATNTSAGINLAALSLPIPDGATILISDREFPANVYPWMAVPGARLERIPTDTRGHPDEARLAERIARGDVAIFALSAVQFANGYLADLERFGRLCREHGTFYVIDAIQAVGAMPMDVRALNADVLATGGHKWLCSPFGTGFTYVRRELHEKVEPRSIGWTSMASSQDFNALVDYRWEFLPDARRYEQATPPFQDLAGMAESLGLLLEVGVDTIAAHVRGLLDPLVAWLADRDDVDLLTPAEPAQRAGILAFRAPGADELFRALRRAGVVCVLREGAIRLAPHFYNTASDVEVVREVLEADLGG